MIFLIVCAHTPGHWVFTYVNHVERKIWLCDPLGPRCANTQDRKDIVKRLNTWLLIERVRLNRPPVADYAMAVNPTRLPELNDSISCGAFVYAYAYFLVLLSRFPATADFRGADRVSLRHAVLDACMTGRLPPSRSAG